MADRRNLSSDADDFVEAFTRRMEANQVGGRLGRLVSHIRNLGAKGFVGGKPHEAEEWIYNLEIHFEMMDCTPVELRKVATCLLEGVCSLLVGYCQTCNTSRNNGSHGVDCL